MAITSYSPNEPSKKDRINHLFVIGIDDYLHHSNLNNACRDAAKFSEVLTKQYDFEIENSLSLFNKDATRENILNSLAQYEEKLTENDNLIIYYSGHGTISKKRTHGFWIPYDSRQGSRSDYIANSTIRDITQELDAHHLYIITDSCFSGAIIPRQSDEKYLAFLDQNRSRRVLASGRSETVSDGPPGKHSPFFECMLTKLLNSDGDRPLSSKELELYISQKTPRNSNQLPIAGYIHGTGDKAGEFVFYPKNYFSTVERNTSPKKRARSDEIVKANFLANISHEIRTPINGIIGLSSLILDLYEEDDELNEFSSLIKVSGERLLRTLDSILALSQLESSINSLNWSILNLKNTCEPIVAKYQEEAYEKGIVLKCEINEAISLQTDHGWFVKVLDHITSNAIKFTNNGGVTVSGALNQNPEVPRVELLVTDTGIGMSEAFIKEKLFNKFTQESEGLNRNFEGAGLGLSIAKRIIEILGGEITVTSIQNQGTTFKVSIPEYRK